MTLGYLLSTIALVGGTLWSGHAERLEGATVIIENDQIIAIGKDVPIPTGATVKTCHGLVITPAFIDSYTQIGLVEVSGVKSSNDTRPDVEAKIRPHLRAIDSFNSASGVLPHQVAYGLTTAGIHLSGGLLSGELSAVNLVSGIPHAHLVGMNVRLSGSREQSRSAHLYRLRSALSQAKVWQKKGEPSDRNDRLNEDQLNALKRLLDGGGRLFVEAHRASDITTALNLGEAFGVKIVIVGGTEAWRLAKRLSQTDTPVILNPISNAPESFDRLFVSPNNLNILIENDVEVALSTFGTHQARKLRQWAGNAVRAGLAYPEAIRAVTVTPAKILGLKDQQGIRVGQKAELVVWSGDPFELSSFPKVIISGGQEVKMMTRQQRLFDRYRCFPDGGAHCENAKISPNQRQ